MAVHLLKRKASLGPISQVTLVTLLFLVTGHDCLDVRFEDPSRGFFLREAVSTIHSVPTTTTNIEEEGANGSATTSIILGATTSGLGSNKEKSKDLLQKSLAKQGFSAETTSSSGHLSSRPRPSLTAEQRTSKAASFGDILHSESFTVVGSSQPVTIRAEYGPFEASQMVPTQYLVPDLMLEEELLAEKKPALITDFEPHQLDLSAHLVTDEVPKDNPVLRVLFHTSNYHNIGHNARICIVLTASIEDDKRRKQQRRTVSQICSLRREEKDGTCLGQLTLPSSWWPPFATQTTTTAQAKKATFDFVKNEQEQLMKQPKVLVDVKYSVFETRIGVPCQDFEENASEKVSLEKIPVTPETPMGAVTLVQTAQSYHQLAKDEMMHMLMPQGSFYPNSKFYVPVFLEQLPHTDSPPITAFTIKCRTRSGLRLLGVEEISKDWKVRVDINARGTIATVTAFKKTLQTTASELTDKAAESFQKDSSTTLGPQELFNWLLVIEDRDYDQWDQPRISWHVKYQRPLDSYEEYTSESDIAIEDDFEDFAGHKPHHSKNSYRLRAKMLVRKDEVQTVIPIAKNKNLMNLAVLTGRQVSRPLKVFIVSQAGDVADVTLHCSCSSVDQSVLKVTTSCTSVYVDGSESRGALAAEIDIKYGSSADYMGKAVFTVWMPETPLNIDVADTRLSQIKGWKVPSSSSSPQATNFYQGSNLNQTHCDLRYQQTSVRVFAKFLAQDPDSGRTEYFPSRSAESDVTDLVIGHGLRISNSGVATLDGNIIQGRSPGRTEIKVVSPITGQEIGMREVKVAKNRETIRGMNVRILTGLGLDVQADPVRRGRYVLKTSYSQLLSSKYQEGLLDIELHMSDDTILPLRQVDPQDYYLAIKSLDNNVIALAPSRDARFPRVIAVGNGQGQLLRTSLELIDACMPTKSSNLPLAVEVADVQVHLKNTKTNAWQTQMTSERSNSQAEMVGNILSNIALRDDSGAGKLSKDYNAYERSSNGGYLNGHLTPLEIGMYILVAVLCAAMAVFMASCFVYASKFRSAKYPVHSTVSLSQLHAMEAKSQSSVQNAHDWIWLGKSTLDRVSQSSESRFSYQPPSGDNVNVISNPQELHLAERIPLNQLHSSSRRSTTGISNPDSSEKYPRQQFGSERGSYENFPEIRRTRRMQLPQIPVNTSNSRSSSRRRRLLPQINTATYTKKVADLNHRCTPTGILPVGYPLFLPTNEDVMSPVKTLPDPSQLDEHKLGAPLRQSPASALPPLLNNEAMQASKNIEAEDDFEFSNPDIYRPSPPRTGASRLFENPFDLTDEDSAPVEVPKKLSPSHVFESTSLGDSLLLMEAEKNNLLSPTSSNGSGSSVSTSTAAGKNPILFDTRTFVIRRSSPSRQGSDASISKEDSAEIGSIKSLSNYDEDALPMGAEAINNDDEDNKDEIEMDYDNLMAYFENLKESTA